MAFREIFYQSQDGLALHARIYAPRQPSAALPLVCLPGLTRNSRDFHELALSVAGHGRSPRSVVAFDYRGRGRSAYDPDGTHYNVRVEAGDVMAGLEALGIERAVFLGTSRGGIIIHILAALAPQLLAGVIFNDIGPEIAPDGLRQIGDYLIAAKNPRDWAEAAALQRSVHGQVFPALTDADWDRFARAIYRDDNGTIRSDYDPALLKMFEAIDFTKKLPDLWPQFDLMSALAMLVIRGENSTLLTRETAEEMRRRHPQMQLVTVPGQGHAPFLETGDLPERIAAFSATVEQPAA